MSTMYAVPTDANAVDALDPAARAQYLGTALYPGIFAQLGEPLAGKVTGMLLEMPTQNILDCLAAPGTLKATIDDALSVLPEDMRAAVAPPSPVSAGPSPTSVLAGASNNLWADEDNEDDEDLPSVGELFASVEKKKASARESARQEDDAMETDCGGAVVESWQLEWNPAEMAAVPSEKLSEWMAARLDEQRRIPRAVVEVLGAPSALELLGAVERVQAHGGMLVEETGKPRTSGGIFIKLLKDATHLPPTEHAAALDRIKREGAEAKKAQQAKKNAAKFVRANSSPSPTKAPLTPTPAAPPAGPPKADLGEFVEAAIRRQQSV